jgi:hypothetical protein
MSSGLVNITTPAPVYSFGVPTYFTSFVAFVTGASLTLSGSAQLVTGGPSSLTFRCVSVFGPTACGFTLGGSSSLTTRPSTITTFIGMKASFANKIFMSGGTSLVFDFDSGYGYASPIVTISGGVAVGDGSSLILKPTAGSTTTIAGPITLSGANSTALFGHQTTFTAGASVTGKGTATITSNTATIIPVGMSWGVPLGEPSPCCSFPSTARM